MQDIGVCNTVNSSICANGEEQDVCEERDTELRSRNHAAGAQGFNEQDKRHDGEDVVVRRKGCQPMNSKISYPDYQDREVDWQDPEH